MKHERLIRGNEIVKKLAINLGTVIFLQHVGWMNLLLRTAPVYGSRKKPSRRMARLRAGKVWLMSAAFFGMRMDDHCAEAV